MAGRRPIPRWRRAAGQGSTDFALVLAQLAVRMRPGFAPAVALTADSLADQAHDEQALAALGHIAADDPLAPVIGLRRAALLDKLDRTDEAVALLRQLAESLSDHAAGPGPAGRHAAPAQPLRRGGRGL